MAVTKKQISALMKDASKAANLILKSIEKSDTIHVSSHTDADGLASAGIIGKSLARLGGTFRLRIAKWVEEKVVDQIAAEKPPLTIFTDSGGGYLDLLSEKLSTNKVIILDHHQTSSETPPAFIHVNPHLHGIDGSRDISGAGVAYFVAKALDKTNVDLAHLAVVGALGDMQDKYHDKSGHRKLGGANDSIVEDAVNTGYLKVETDLMFFGRETRPIHQALARTTNPFLPGISGEEDKSLAFLANLGIKPKQGDKWRALRDLSEEEKKNLFSAIADYLVSKGFASDAALNLIGNVYTLAREEPWTPLRDAREFTVMLNATGRMDKAGLGVAICMGDRGKCLQEAITVIDEYRRTITKYLSWLTEKPERLEELESIYVVRGDSVIDEKVISPVSSILSTTLSKLGKPIIAYSLISGENMVKVSARAVEPLIKKGLNLGEILNVAADKHSGRGGGHDIAAGAQIPIKNVEPFIKLVDKLVKKQLKGIQLEG
ncbi:MAG: DHH family phosphoesterase [Candidatus Bathyarchaeota archaeon]|nr:MAG: DHH family phosphoesterase [Candidatus Bathyarchaeota archaeon]